MLRLSIQSNSSIFVIRNFNFYEIYYAVVSHHNHRFRINFIELSRNDLFVDFNKQNH